LSNSGLGIEKTTACLVPSSRAWGLDDFEHTVLLRPQFPIEAGLVARRFTAAAVLLLEQQRSLSLEDDVR
jgi:hypothetical protein